MVAPTSTELSTLQQCLIDGLEVLSNWALTPVYGDKRPYRKNWQSEDPISLDLIVRDIRNGKAKGYGLRTGAVSGGIVAVDADGHAAHDKILELSGGVPLPETVAFTSNKPGRCQYLFYIPQEYWEAIATKKISTGVKGDDGKEQKLELRWDGCQSVLPPSVHPETGCYRWRRSPEEVAPAPAPAWLVEQMLTDSRESHETPQLKRTPSIADDVPLYQCLTKNDRALIDQGAALGNRNDSGAKLARNLIGTAQRLNYLGIRFDGDPRQLFDDYCHRCNPSLAAREAETIWKSAQKDNPTPSLTDDALENCAKAWLRNQEKASGRGTSSYNNSLAPHHNFGGGGTGSGGTGNGGTGNGTGGMDPGERLRLDVLALLKESDPVIYEVMRADIQSRYRLNGKALERIIRSISQRTKEAEVEDLGLDELFDLPCDNIEYVVPGMLPAGEAALLIANPKAGKSLLAYDAAFAVATGEDTFLGERCKQGKVLIVQCDESTGTAKGRLLKRGFRREDAPNVRFMHKFSITQLGALEDKLETFRPTLVIIDSLRRINAGREVSENSAEFADYIYQLKELCARYNAALILIHHSNKNIDAVGVERVRGSSAIAGAVWGVWDLTQIPKPDPNNKKKLIIDPKDPTRILSIIARDVEGQRLRIELDPENNHWINHGQQGISEEEVREQKTHSARVVELLKSIAPVGLEACEINEHLSIGRGIYSILNRLLGQKIIGSRPSDKDRRRTVYFCSTVTHPQPDNPPPPTDTDPNVIEYAEPIGISTVQSSITFDHNSIAFDHKPLADEWDEQASNVEPESHTAYSITSTLSGGGRGEKTPEYVTVNSPELSHMQPTPVEQKASISGDEIDALDAIAPTPTATPDTPALATEEEEVVLWMEESTIAEIAQDLANESFCDGKATLAILRTTWDARAMNLACKRLTQERHSQIMAWVLQLNAEAQPQLEEIQVGDRIFVNCWPHTDCLGPYLVERIEGDFAKVEMFPQLLSVSDLRRG